ncbi:MAG: PaaI family thioesterase [Candidatus Dormibacteria bacterium]
MNWTPPPSAFDLDLARQASVGSFSESIGVTFEEVTPERVVCSLLVTDRHLQPGGILHGGATIALAETVASMGTVQHIDLGRETCMGQEISASHMRSTSSGRVTATGVPVNRSRTAMTWDVRVTREDGALISWVRCTIAIRERRAANG